jgi:hypothetical protein
MTTAATFPAPGFTLAPPDKERAVSASYSFCAEAHYNHAVPRGNVAYFWGYNVRSEKPDEPMFMDVLETHWCGQGKDTDAQFERYLEVRSIDRKTIRRPWGFVVRKYSDYIRHDLLCDGIYWSDPKTGNVGLFAQPYRGNWEFQFTGSVSIKGGGLHCAEITALYAKVAALEARLAKLDQRSEIRDQRSEV